MGISMTTNKVVVENEACEVVSDGSEHPGKEVILVGTEQKVGKKVKSSCQRKKQISRSRNWYVSSAVLT